MLYGCIGLWCALNCCKPMLNISIIQEFLLLWTPCDGFLVFMTLDLTFVCAVWLQFVCLCVTTIYWRCVRVNVCCSTSACLKAIYGDVRGAQVVSGYCSAGTAHLPAQCILWLMYTISHKRVNVYAHMYACIYSRSSPVPVPVVPRSRSCICL